jgi:PPP family 3-phenylpropionic acid transporter
MRQTAAGRTASAFALRVSILFAAVFAVAGTSVPYLPVWLDWIGLSPREIALVTAAPLLVRVAATPAIAFAADRLGEHRRVLVALAWASLAALLALAQSQTFATVLLLNLLFALAWTAVMPLTETVAMTGVKRAGLDYGRMRLWGSLSFIAATFYGGWIIDHLGPGSAVWLVVASGAGVVAAAHFLRQLAASAERPRAAVARLRIADAFGLVRSHVFLLFLLATGAVQGAHAVFYTFGTLHWRSLGLSTAWCGLLWTIGVVAEIALFAFAGPVARRIAPAELVALGAAAATLRWTAMAYDPPFALLIPLQILHALTYGATHLGAMHFMSRVVPEAQGGTAQALYASVTAGVAMGGAMLAAGPLYAAYAGGAYWAMAMLAGAGLLASIALQNAWRGSTRRAHVSPTGRDEAGE